LDVPDRGYRPSHKNKEHSLLDHVCGQVLLPNLVLVLSWAAVNDRDLVSLGEATYTATEATGHAHQMGVVQLFVGPIHQATPPVPKPATRVAQRVVGVQDDAIDTLITVVHQVAVPLGQCVGHVHMLDRPAPSGA